MFVAFVEGIQLQFSILGVSVDGVLRERMVEKDVRWDIRVVVVCIEREGEC